MELRHEVRPLSCHCSLRRVLVRAGVQLGWRVFQFQETHRAARVDCRCSRVMELTQEISTLVIDSRFGLVRSRARVLLHCRHHLRVYCLRPHGVLGGVAEERVDLVVAGARDGLVHRRLLFNVHLRVGVPRNSKGKGLPRWRLREVRLHVVRTGCWCNRYSLKCKLLPAPLEKSYLVP